MRTEDIESRLRVSPLFRDVSAEQLHRFARETTARRLEDGQALWRPGEVAT